MRSTWTMSWSAVIALAMMVFLFAATHQQQGRKQAEEAVLKSNSACMVCHIDFDDEELTVQHRKAGVTCAACHGPCLEHMDDEMAATRPDRLFGRGEVKEMCSECHGEHKNQEAVEAFHKEWYGRRRPNGQLITKDSICTDCHGRHVRLQAPMPQAQPVSESWTRLFNRVDLTGWKPSGHATWVVENGVLVGQQGNDHTGGDLFTEDSHEDFELVVTFMVQRPANSGIWFRAGEDGAGYQMDVVDRKEHGCATGSIWSQGLLSRVTDENAANRDGWNTASISAVKDKITVILNGVVVADLKDDSYSSGRIGFQVHPGRQYANMKIMVREVKIRRLSRL